MPLRSAIDGRYRPCRAAYREWIEQHYRERRGVEGFAFDPSTNELLGSLPSGHILKGNQFTTDRGHVESIEWAYPADNDVTLRWRNDIRIGEFDEICSVEHLIWIEFDRVSSLTCSVRIRIAKCDPTSLF